MPFTLWAQDVFTKGELSPYMYSRASVNEFFNGLKTATNVLNYPSGAAGKRFGTLLQHIFTLDEAPQGIEAIQFETFQYGNECTYQIVIVPLRILIFLEGTKVAQITTTFDQSQIKNMSTTILGRIFRMAMTEKRPQDLKRAAATGVNISSAATYEITVASASWVAGQVLPVTFTFNTTAAVTSPQIIFGSVTYFLATTSTTKALVFESAAQAKNYLVTGDTLKAIEFVSVGNTDAHVLNTWTVTDSPIKVTPCFDFNGSTTPYTALTFTPSATSGNVTITVSGSGYSLLDTSYVGGAFFGNGGSGIITAVASHTSFTIQTESPFRNTTAIRGELCLLAEPAWSNARGWPQVCASYQNRSIYANTRSLPNGFWASAINDFSDFNILNVDDDDAISWYPSSNNINYIKFVVPYRSITVHTNTGIFSSPLSDVNAITPSNFTLQLQDSSPADVIIPEAIDNQIIVLSGNDAHQMLWDGINNAYNSTTVSIVNEQTIRNPVDETAYSPLRRAGSKFIFIVNENGSMAAFQTLISEGVSGITPLVMNQSYGAAYYKRAASSPDGRCWFICQRDVADNDFPISITATLDGALVATASNFDTALPTAIKFTTTGTLPSGSSPIDTNHYFWAVGIDADTFDVYLTQEDAVAGVNKINFTSAGTSSNVVPWRLTFAFTLEELNEDVKLDCAVRYVGAPLSTVPASPLFNAQDVKMIGDGFGFQSDAEENVNGNIIFKSHGMLAPVSDAYIGFPIKMVIEPMPLAMSMGSSMKETALTRPKHVRDIRLMFNNTIGGTVNGVPIALNKFDMSNIGMPPIPARGIFELGPMSGWDDFNNPVFTIEHDEPFDIQLTGIFYSVDF